MAATSLLFFTSISFSFTRLIYDVVLRIKWVGQTNPCALISSAYFSPSFYFTCISFSVTTLIYDVVLRIKWVGHTKPCAFISSAFYRLLIEAPPLVLFILSSFFFLQRGLSPPTLNELSDQCLQLSTTRRLLSSIHTNTERTTRPGSSTFKTNGKTNYTYSIILRINFSRCGSV